MLILSRKSGQRIRIGENIQLVVLDIQGSVVKLGIEAPRHITVYRQELYDEICQTNQQSAASSLTLPTSPLQ